MKKTYKICFLIYSRMLIFAFLFMLLLLGASGHRVTFKLHHYLIGIYPIINVLFLIKFYRIPSRKRHLKLTIGISVLILLIVSLYFALQNLYSIITENLIGEFKFIATLFITLFIGTIIYLFKEITLELKNKT